MSRTKRHATESTTSESSRAEAAGESSGPSLTRYAGTKPASSGSARAKPTSTKPARPESAAVTKALWGASRMTEAVAGRRTWAAAFSRFFLRTVCAFGTLALCQQSDELIPSDLAVAIHVGLVEELHDFVFGHLAIRIAVDAAERTTLSAPAPSGRRPPGASCEVSKMRAKPSMSGKWSATEMDRRHPRTGALTGSPSPSAASEGMSREAVGVAWRTVSSRAAESWPTETAV